MAGSAASPEKAILFAFSANLGIAICKTGAWIFTGSASMLAEAIHSFADTGNQCLLLLGLHGAKKPPDAEHPLGYGKLSYFWSFMVALMLFSIGGLFSLYEGWHKLHATEPVEHVWIALVVLGVSIGLECVSMWGCLREVNKLRQGRSLWRWLNESRNAELVVVFGEDFAALLGLVLAFGFIALAGATGDPVYDALGSMCIGALLVLVAVFVAIRIRALLIGRSGDPEIVTEMKAAIAESDAIEEVLNLITVHLGPQVMLAAKIKMRKGLPIEEACAHINAMEARLKERFPDVGWCFIEPDTKD